MSTDYNQKAQDFLDKNNITIKRIFTGTRKFFKDDTEKRDTYQITISRKPWHFVTGKTTEFSIDFGDSIYNTKLRAKDSEFITPLGYVKTNYQKEYISISKWPDYYTILTTLWYDTCSYDTFEDFCDSFWCSTDSRKALETYLSCQEQQSKINKFFTSEEIEDLRSFE